MNGTFFLHETIKRNVTAPFSKNCCTVVLVKSVFFIRQIALNFPLSLFSPNGRPSWMLWGPMSGAGCSPGPQAVASLQEESRVARRGRACSLGPRHLGLDPRFSNCWPGDPASPHLWVSLPSPVHRRGWLRVRVQCPALRLAQRASCYPSKTVALPVFMQVPPSAGQGAALELSRQVSKEGIPMATRYMKR